MRKWNLGLGANQNYATYDKPIDDTDNQSMAQIIVNDEGEEGDKEREGQSMSIAYEGKGEGGVWELLELADMIYVNNPFK